MARKPSGTEVGAELTDNEGSLLALIVRREPVTAYQLIRTYETSPVSGFNESKGSIYPSIRRLKERKLISAETVEGDGRNAERLRSTAAGREAVKTWVMHMRPSHALLNDPLRTKIISFDLLSREERLQWIEAARALIQAKIKEVEEYDARVSIPFQPLLHQSTLIALRGRLEWLDKVQEAALAEES